LEYTLLNERSAAKPSILSLEEAVRNIVETRNRRTPVGNPFVFVVGAGISSPSIKLASQIADECEKVAHSKGVTELPKSNSTIDRYFHWFEKAHPDPALRQEFMQRLVETAPISAANFRLAHLLTAGFSNLVITPNFDTLLSRALRLFGWNRFRVCDHPATTARIIPELAQAQIIHVHGSFQFYDIVNLRRELGQRAQSEMAGLLTAIFRDRVPIVLGYSGWDGDVITKALKQRLRQRDWPLPYTLYWFCHDTCPSLDWLCSNPAVRFVVPPEGSKLSAEDVLGRLIREMGYKEPALARRPVWFFTEQLEESLPSGKGEPDPYSLRSVAARLRRAAELESAEFKEANKYMERVRSLLRTARYEEAASSILSLPLDKLNNPQLEELLEKVESIASFVPKSVQAKLLHVRTLVEDQLKAFIAFQDELLFLEES
jgi:hypothetical protein